MRRYGARNLPVTTAQAAANARLLGGPLRLVGWSFNDGAAGQTLTNSGSQTSPAAGTTIASLSLPNGEYTVQWSVELSGTLAAADTNNFGVYDGATLVAQSANEDIANVYPQEPFTVVITGGPATLAIKNIALATAGAVYAATLIVTPSGPSLGQITDGNTHVADISIPQGGIDRTYFDIEGVLIETELRVSATVGIVTGSVWYYLESDYERPEKRTERVTT